jgi:hypothetical protein
MKRFSFKAFGAVACLHIAVTARLISAAISRMHGYDHSDTFPWLAGLSWMWMSVPVLLSHYFHFSPARYFYFLALPWSLFVAFCCGFIVPYFSRWRHRVA